VPLTVRCQDGDDVVVALPALEIQPMLVGEW
jgi:hypothetical protein